MRQRLDCLVIGYNDIDFAQHESMVSAKGSDTTEYRIFLKDHIKIAGRRLPYLDAVSYFLNEKATLSRSASQLLPSNNSYYHVAEVPNTAAVYLTSNLRKRGFAAEYVSLFGAEKKRLAELAEEGRPRVVAITTTFYLTPFPVIEVIRFLRDLDTQMRIVVGGPLIMNLYQDLNSEALGEILVEIGADIYVADAQGEATLVKILYALGAGANLGQIPNLFIPGERGVTYTGLAPENNSLEDWRINWTLLADYNLGSAVQTRTARSCAFKCSFCDYPVRAGPLSLANVDTVVQELREISEAGVEYVIFIDDTFNVPIDRFRELCRRMVQERLGLNWFSYFRCSNTGGQETFDLMQESGCCGVFLGIESGDDRVLKNMNKAARVDQYASAMDELHHREIVTFASFITGFPGETPETVERTIEFINQTQPTFYRAEPWWYNPRSPIQKQSEEFQISGRGYLWRHATMDVHGAVDAADAIFWRVENSVWMPMYNFDFWALPYLLSKGMTQDQIHTFHRLGQRLMKGNFDTSSQAQERLRAAETALRSFFAEVVLQPAKYSVPPEYEERLMPALGDIEVDPKADAGSQR